jgi:hypothetical protein
MDQEEEARKKELKRLRNLRYYNNHREEQIERVKTNYHNKKNNVVEKKQNVEININENKDEIRHKFLEAYLLFVNEGIKTNFKFKKC